jgi:hypothetical protein
MKRTAVSIIALATVGIVFGISDTAWAQRACTPTLQNCPNQTVTTSKIQIGGAGSLSSAGSAFSNPGRLDDGTIAEADLTFTFDRSTSRLTILAENKTTTTASLTAFGFNTTADITMMSLTSHNGSLPWAMAFDLDRTDDVVDTNPTLKELRMDGFGRLNVFFGNKGIDTGGNGGNKNEILAGQSVTFVVQVTGNTSNITACSFTSVGSYIPPGSKIVTAVGRFQAGVQGGSAFIGPCTGGDLLVRLADFNVANNNGEVVIRWKTAVEIDNAGFAILAQNARTKETVRLNTSLIPGEGTSVSGASYSYRQLGLTPGVKYLISLEDWDVNGVNTIHNAKSVVPNADKPRIRLVSPSYEASATAQMKMSWQIDGRLSSVMEFSADPTFPKGGTMRIPAGRSTSRTLTPGQVEMIRSIGSQSVEKGVYWRVSGKDVTGALATSQTSFLVVE